jgi:hypothetical protein
MAHAALGDWYDSGYHDAQNVIDVSQIRDELGEKPSAKKIKAWLLKDIASGAATDPVEELPKSQRKKAREAWADGWASYAEKAMASGASEAKEACGCAKEAPRGDVDTIAADELRLFADNESAMYSQKQSIRKNLRRKMLKGTYDEALAAKLWLYWVDEAAKRYTKEFGGKWSEQFNKATREHVARELAADEGAKLKSGEFDKDLGLGGRETGEAREAKENPVDVSDGSVPWVKISRDPEQYKAAMAVADKIGPVDGCKKIYELLGPTLIKEDQEVFCVVLLDVRQQVRGVVEVHRGSRSRVATSLVDVMRVVLQSGAEGFIVTHNHPTGKASPSPADRDLTKSIRKAAELFDDDVAFVDHVIIGNGQCYSFADKKLHKFRK